MVGSDLYVANFQTAIVVGMDFLGGGDLLEIAGSPFTFTDAGVEQLHPFGGNRIFLANSLAESFSSMSVDNLGVATEDQGSPFAAGGRSTAWLARDPSSSPGLRPLRR